MTVCVTGATGFIGAHVAKLAAEGGEPLRVTYRDEARLARLDAVKAEAVKADVLDRGALRRAFRGCDTVFHAAGYVGSRPAERVWQVNALSPRLAVEAAAAEGVGRLVLTSSVAAIEFEPGLTYPDSKHEGEGEAFAAGARHGVEVVAVNPTYVLGVPLDREPADISTRMIGNYMRGRLPAVVDGQTNIVDVRDVAKGHLLAAERGRAGERYVLGGHDVSWVELLERVAELSGCRHPLAVLPPETAMLARASADLGLPGPAAAEGIRLMARDWRHSSAKARRELGYRARPLERTLRDSTDWYSELIDQGVLGGGPPSPFSLAAAGLRLAGRTGMLAGVPLAERWTGRRLVVRP